jgi:hypothetical protein
VTIKPMTKHPRRFTTGRGDPPISRDHADDWTRHDTVACAVLGGLLVAAPLVPSESTVELGVSATWIMVLLILCAAWLASVCVRRRRVVRVGVPDVLAGLLLALVLLSAGVMAGPGYARATINAAWQWAGFLVFFFLSRQLLHRAEAVRAASAVMLALAMGLSALACYQYFYSLPQIRAEFARNPDSMLQAAGIEPASSSPERKLFEDRLNSTEPLATFALANSLAGFLAPWLIVALGIAAREAVRKTAESGQHATGGSSR